MSDQPSRDPGPIKTVTVKRGSVYFELSVLLFLVILGMAVWLIVDLLP